MNIWIIKHTQVETKSIMVIKVDLNSKLLRVAISKMFKMYFIKGANYLTNNSKNYKDKLGNDENNTSKASTDKRPNFHFVCSM